MISQDAGQEATVEEINFPNGNQAKLVAPTVDAGAADILDALDIDQPKCLIIIIGVAAQIEEALKPRLVQLFSRGIAQAAADAGALIIDGGTQAGVIEMMGQGVADRGRKSTLLGVAPIDKVAYPSETTQDKHGTKRIWPLDPNHSHFVLVQGKEWSEKTETMYQLAETLANRSRGELESQQHSSTTSPRDLVRRAKETDKQTRKIPVVTIVVGCRTDSGAQNEILRSAQNGWPIIVIDDSGPLANEIAGRCQQFPVELDGTVVSEILTDGDIHVFSFGDKITKLEQLIGTLLGRHTSLELAWKRFAIYDAEALSQRTSFERLQLVILLLGVLGTLLALMQTYFNLETAILHYALVVVPVTVSVLIAGANYFRAGKKWVLLRASAEAIKREIYQYRAQAERYSSKGGIGAAQIKLARKIEFVSRQLMQTVVNLSALDEYEESIPPEMYGASAEDDGLSYLSPDRYLAIRLGDQVSYYRSKASKLERKLKWLQWLILIAGGVGTLLAAIGLELWIALTTAIVTALATYLEYQQVENRLIRYNQAATDLVNLRGWWTALSAEEKVDPKNVDKLVEYTERILQNEHEVWVQGMQDALADLHLESAADGADQ